MTSFSRIAESSVRAFTRARGVARPARSATVFARRLSSSSDSPAPPNTVGASFVTPVMPRIGWFTTVMVLASTTPRDPFSSARTETSTVSWPLRRVRSSVVVKATGLLFAPAPPFPLPAGGASAVDTLVPAGMKMSPGAGVGLENRTVPKAKSLVFRARPRRATTMSRADPSAVSTNPDSYTISSCWRSTASSRAKASAMVRVRLPTFRSVSGAVPLPVW